MNKKKLLMFGLPLLAVVLVSALLVGYLSNPVEVDVEVQSPIEISIYDGNAWVSSIDLGVAYGGDTVSMLFREKNRGSTEITSDLVIIVNEDDVDNVCAEITEFEFKNINSEVWTSIVGTCAVQTDEEFDYLEFRISENIIPAGQNEQYDVKVTFAENAEGIYETTVQHMI